jgi:hypothetical protein
VFLQIFISNKIKANIFLSKTSTNKNKIILTKLNLKIFCLY